jgi:hypothetical protein
MVERICCDLIFYGVSTTRFLGQMLFGGLSSLRSISQKLHVRTRDDISGAIQDPTR